MQLFIKLDKTFVLDMEENSTVEDLHNKIYEKTGIPQKFYFLTGNAKPLSTGQLSDYKLNHGSTIYISLRSNFSRPIEEYQIFIKFDKTETLTIDNLDTVFSLKNKINNKFGYDYNKYYLVSNGKLLGDGNLYDLGIKSHSTIHGSFRSQFCEYQNT